MKNKLIVINLIAALILFGAFVLYTDIKDARLSSKIETFPSKSACEDAKQAECVFSQCDVNCANTPTGYFKGWVSKIELRELESSK